MSREGFYVPPGTIPKGFPNEKGIILQPWELDGLYNALCRTRRDPNFESQFPTRFSLVRPMKHQPDNPPGYFSDGGYFMKGDGGTYVGGSSVGGTYPKDKWKYHRGHHLWVKETWQFVCWTRDWESGHYDDFFIPDVRLKPNAQEPRHKPTLAGEGSAIAYRHADHDSYDDDDDFVWRPSSTMPRWASRYDLKILNVVAARIQDRTKGVDGNIVEKTGVGAWFRDEFGNWRNPHPPSWKEKKEPGDDDEPYYDHREAFEDFKLAWDARYAKQGLGWDTNPWVYIIDTRIVTESEYLMLEIRRLQAELRKAGAHKPRTKEESMQAMREALNGDV